MITKQLVGIYLEKEALHYWGAARTWMSWKTMISDSAMAPFGILHGPAFSVLREFLQQISPGFNLQFYFALPRNRFFIRDIQLPAIPLEDALLSVQSSLPLTCHFPLDEIYHDILLCRVPDGTVQALVIYALRKDIKPVLDIFSETGHEKSLKGLFPISLGIGAWLNLQEYDMPLGIMTCHENQANELAVYQKNGCVLSLSWQNGMEERESDIRKELACHKFGLSADDIYAFGGCSGAQVLPDPLHDRLPWLPSVRQNMGGAALSCGLSGQQVILLNGTAPQIRIFHLWKVFIPVFLGVAVFLSIWTLHLQHVVHQRSDVVKALKDETSQLQQQVRPLEKNRDALKKTESLFADIGDYIRLRPKLFSCFNEIARLIPEGTWFSRSSFQGADLTLQGQSKDTLKVIEQLRTSALFDQVKLVGSVSRMPTGVEQFSLTIRLKDVEPGS